MSDPVSPNQSVSKQLLEGRITPELLEKIKEGKLIAVSQPEGPIDYTVPIQAGQLWLHKSLVVAFVLEVNAFAVIYQNKVDFASENPTFDFKAGQFLMTHHRFRETLKERNAYLVNTDSPKFKGAVEVGLQTYRVLLANNKIPEPKVLPNGENEYQTLLELEHYARTKRIVPPPKEHRNRRGFHSFQSIKDQTLYVYRLWDPKTDNWVLPNGFPDLTAGIGFGFKYHAFWIYVDVEAGTEPYSFLVSRIIEFLKSNGFIYTEKTLRAALETLAPDQSTDLGQVVFEYAPTNSQLIESETDSDLNQVDLQKPDVIPFYELSYLFADGSESCSEPKLVIFLSHEGKIAYQLTIFSVINKTAIHYKPSLSLIKIV